MALHLRLTLIYAALMAIILSLFSVVLYISMRQNLEVEMDRRLQLRASQVQLTIWPGTESLTPEDMTTAKLDHSLLSELDAPGLYVQVQNANGQVVGASGSLQRATFPGDPASFATALQGRPVLRTVSVGIDRAVRLLSQPIRSSDGHVVGVLQVGQSRQPLEDTMDGLRSLLLALGATCLVAAGFVGWIVAMNGLRPLGAIADRAAAIAAQRDFTRRIGLQRTRDEVGQLATTVDRLLATVEDVLRMHREFVADTSHELRNPLLAIRTNLDLLDRVPEGESRAECLREARDQVERMTRLVGDLLLLARAEAGQILEPRPVALLPLVQRVARAAKQRAPDRRITLERAEPIDLLADEGRIVQILTNLVDNAVRHTPPGGTVSLGLRRRAGGAVLTVADTGEGIPPDRLPRIFDRFYRGAQDAWSEPGSGLGLTIVKHLAEAHGGHVQAESNPGGGSRFSVWLPLQTQSEAPPHLSRSPELAGREQAHAPTPT